MKKSKIVIVIVAIVLAILIIGLMVLFGLKLLKKGEEPSIDNTEVSKEDITYTYTENGIPKFIDGEFSKREVKSSNDALLALDDMKENMHFKDVFSEFQFDSEEKSENITYYRFNQFYKGIPVFNQNIIVGVENEKVSSFSGYYIPGIEIEVTPKKTQEEIEKIVKNHFSENTNITKNELSIWADYDKQSLVYVVNANTSELAKEMILDANTGEILTETDLFVYADLYPYTGKGLDGITHKINLEEFYDVAALKTRYRFLDPERNISIADYRSTGMLLALIASAVPGSTPITVDITDGKIETTSKNQEFIESAVTAMAHYEKIYDYYLNVLGRNSYDNKGSKIIINLGVTAKSFTTKDLNNAAWYAPTSQMYIGNYDGKSFAASLDVLGHEFTHGVVSCTSKFSTTPKDKTKAFETGALNEGYADILGALIEGENWIMGENNVIVRNLSDPLSLKHPKAKGEKYYYPDGYLKEGFSLAGCLAELGSGSDYSSDIQDVTVYDNGGVHRNSTVVGHAAYLMYENGAFESKEQMAKVWYNSLFLLSSYSDFEDCALAVIKSAQNLGLSEDSIIKVRSAFEETKMLEPKKCVLKGKVKNGTKLIEKAIIEIYEENNQEPVATTTSNQNGEYELNLKTGNYKIKVKKQNLKEFNKALVINGDKIFDIALNGNGKDVKVTIYYMDSDKKGNPIENHTTEVVESGTVLGKEYILKAVNSTFGGNLKSDGKSFTMDLGGIQVEFAWYYRGTNNKFDWDKPIYEDTEIEMKTFDGIFDDKTFTDPDSLVDSIDKFSEWFH